jgi:hypothetical protein
VSVEIEPAAQLSAEQLRRIEHVARTCPVRRALEAGFAFDERIAAPWAEGAGAGELAA